MCHEYDVRWDTDTRATSTLVIGWESTAPPHANVPRIPLFPDDRSRVQSTSQLPFILIHLLPLYSCTFLLLLPINLLPFQSFTFLLIFLLSLLIAYLLYLFTFYLSYSFSFLPFLLIYLLPLLIYLNWKKHSQSDGIHCWPPLPPLLILPTERPKSYKVRALQESIT